MESVSKYAYLSFTLLLRAGGTELARYLLVLQLKRDTLLVPHDPSVFFPLFFTPPLPE